MHKLLLGFFVSLCFTFSISGQQPKKPKSIEIHNSIKKLNFLGSVLYVAAHPDDENTRLISYITNELNARTGYLSLTRGDGGQNLIGSEIRELLGVIRTQELLTAREIDGGEQLFTRANDFGYSKHPDETLSIWNKEEVMSDVVWGIRKFKPDVIINRFDHRTPGTTHGHHTTSAVLSVEAFDLVNNPAVYPEQLKHVSIWQPKRLFFNTYWRFYGGKDKFEKIDKSQFVGFDIGKYYPELGLSNTEIASLSRSQHKSQGFGNTGTRGSQLEYLEPIKGGLPKGGQDLFEGIDTSWNRVDGGKEIGNILLKVEQDFNFTNPGASLTQLTKAYTLIQNLKDAHWKEVKTREIKEIIVACAGLYLEVSATSEYATPSDNITIKTEAINRSSSTILLERLTIENLTVQENLNTGLKENISFKKELTGTIPASEKYTSPYWLTEKGSLGMYKVSDPLQIGLAESKRNTIAVFNLKIENTSIPFVREVIYKTNDPVAGEVYKPFEVVPEISVGLSDKVIIFDTNKTKNVAVKIKAYKDNLSGSLKLNIPKDWKVAPKEIAIVLAQKGEEQVVNFEITPPNFQSEGVISPSARIYKNTYNDEVVSIDYNHIPNQTVILPAEAKVVKLDIVKKGEQIGYIEGAGDIVPESLEQIGYQVTIIKPDDISAEVLKKYDAIVVGIRAYNTVETLKYKQATLLEYVKGGGNLIIQYNTNHRLKVTENLGPYPLKLSRDRVTNENAKVDILDKNHPVLNTPNKITAQDFEGWVQERGLYFPNEWAKEYTPILGMKDKGETQKEGSLLVAKYGKGHYVYTGLSFFREFPAGVPGAYRLFANLLSLGK